MRSMLISLFAPLCCCCALLPSASILDAPPEQREAVVFDIDGTLTPTVFSILDARGDAAKAVRMFAEKGYKIIYLSTRMSLLQAGIPGWLKAKGFPEGSLHVAQTDSEHKNAAVFKARILNDYKSHGWNVKFAYGDSSTDFEAYKAAGIPKERVFALLREGEVKCQLGESQECLRGWTEHLDYITKVVPAALSKGP